MRGLFGLAPAADWRGRGEQGCVGRVGVGLSCPTFPVRRRAHSFSPTTATTSTVSINIARSRDGLSPVGWLHSLLLLDSRPLLRPDMVLVGVSWGCPMSHWSVRHKSKQTPCPAFSQVLSASLSYYCSTWRPPIQIHPRWNRYKKLKRHQTKRQYGISKTTK